MILKRLNDFLLILVLRPLSVYGGKDSPGGHAEVKIKSRLHKAVFKCRRSFDNNSKAFKDKN